MFFDFACSVTALFLGHSFSDRFLDLECCSAFIGSFGGLL